MARFNLNDYVEVKDRLPLFFKDHPDGRIDTTIEHLDFSSKPAVVVIKAFIYKDHETAVPLATGLAYEKEGVGGMANKTAFVENCETSAIGRALANADYTVNGKRPSREEMEKVQRYDINDAVKTDLIKNVQTLAETTNDPAILQRVNEAIQEGDMERLETALEYLKNLSGDKSQ